MKEIKKSELEKLYNEMTNRDLAEELGVTTVTLIKYLRESGIHMKGKGSRTATGRKRKVAVL